MSKQRAEPRASLGLVFLRLLALTGLWIVLVEADLQHPAMAALSVVAATAVAIGVGVDLPPQVRPLGLLRFIPFFAWKSLSSGVDVAVRAFRRRALDPGLIHYTTGLSPGSSAQVFFAAVISVLPGTLCADVDERSLTIHIIDCGKDPREFLAQLEQRVAALFGQHLATAPRGSA